MSAANPRWYKWFPTVSCDLGTMPFEGDWTVDDKIFQTTDWSGVGNTWSCNPSTQEFGRYVPTRVGNRIKQVWTPGVTIGPRTITNPEDPTDVRVCPVWFGYYGDGVCTVKVPNGELEPVEVT